MSSYRAQSDLMLLILLSLLLLVGCGHVDNDADIAGPFPLPRNGPPPDLGPSDLPLPDPAAASGVGQAVTRTEDLANQVFTFSDGAAFGVPGSEVTLAIDANGVLLPAVLVAGSSELTGTIFVDDEGCTFVIETSSIITLEPETVLLFDPCEVDTAGRLMLVNQVTGASSTSD